MMLVTKRKRDINMDAHDYKVDGSIEQDSVSINLDDKNYLEKFLTKQMCKILLILSHKTLSNKELAKRMGLSSSALGSILQRMKKSKIQLLIMDREDRYVFYSLSSVAYAYVKDNLVEKEDSEENIIRFGDEKTSDYIECTEALCKLKNCLSVDSMRELENFFNSFYVKGNRENRSVLDDFIIRLAKMKQEDCGENFDKMIAELDGVVLRENILHCVNLYLSMMRLRDIYDQEWELAYDFVDSIFEFKGEGVGLKFLEKCKNLETEEIAEMGKGLFEIASISKRNNHSRIEFVDCWEVYIPRRQFIRYIARAYEKQMST